MMLKAYSTIGRHCIRKSNKRGELMIRCYTFIQLYNGIGKVKMEKAKKEIDQEKDMYASEGRTCSESRKCGIR